MAFSSLQAEQAGGTATMLHVGWNIHERLMVERETVVGTEGCSSQELVFSLEREGHAKLVLQDHRWEVFPSQWHHSALYPLKATGVFSTVTKEGRKDSWQRFCAPVAAPRTIMQGWDKDGESYNISKGLKKLIGKYPHQFQVRKITKQLRPLTMKESYCDAQTAFEPSTQSIRALPVINSKCCKLVWLA